jgi:hypothetical protein
MARGTSTRRAARRARWLWVALALHALPAAALDGREVMLKVEARPRGADEFLRGTWRLVDEKGGERVRETRSYWQDQRARKNGVHSRRLVIFDAPENIRGTAFLVQSQLAPEAEDLRWIYLPGLRKVRRVSGAQRGDAFAGTDFAYEDLAERGVDEDEHRLLRDEPLDGRIQHVVESTPVAESAYARRVAWIDAERFTLSKLELYDRPDRLQKRLTARWRQADGLWFWDRLEMEHLLRRHRTVVETREVAHDQRLGDELWSEARLGLEVP